MIVLKTILNGEEGLGDAGASLDIMQELNEKVMAV